MGIYTERKISFAFGAAVLLTVFFALYGIWLAAGPELTREEGLYAAAAAEAAPDNPVAMVHGWATPECFPLFPAAASLLHRLAGVPMESALRGISMLMLLAGAVMAYFAASSRRSPRAGFVAAAMYSSSLLAMYTTVKGTPVTSNAFWLFSAQLVFFQYGVRKSDWNRAWIYSALLLVPGFLSGGLVLPALFAFPMFFFRRPLSVTSKFRKPGFAAALALLLSAVLCWWAKYSTFPQQVSIYDIWWSRLAVSGYLKEFLAFPFELVFFLLPWSFIAWLPFCVALQAVDGTPIFSRYLRTLIFPTLALLWLFPAVTHHDLFFLVGPLSVLTGDFYELGVRRYGAKMRRALVLAEVFALVVLAVVVAGCFAPSGWLKAFVSLDLDPTMTFRERPGFMVVACGLIFSSLLVALYIHRLRESEPVWMILLAVPVAAALIYNGLMLPYYAQSRSKRAFGGEVRQALAGESGADVLYTLNLRNFYGGLFYTGLPVRRLAAPEDIPRGDGDRVIYLLCAEFPRSAEYSWSNLFRPDYKYNKHPLALWKGVPRQRPRFNEAEDETALRNGENGAKE